MYRHNILLVDDDVTVFERAQILLSEEYNVHYAPSGRQALEFLSGQIHPDLILLDIVMPEMDGYETLNAIKSMDVCKYIPVMFLTGASEPTFELKALKSGAKDFISKPFDPAVFIARVELCLLSDNVISLQKLSETSQELTQTELLILKYISKGYSNEEISVELHYSYGYIKQLISKIFEKLGITGRKELRQFYR